MFHEGENGKDHFGLCQAHPSIFRSVDTTLSPVRLILVSVGCSSNKHCIWMQRSRDFPPKEEVTSPVGTDVMGPWVRLQATDVLYLCRDIVHMDPSCSIISHTPYCLTTCYCLDKLHKLFHCEVDTNFCLHLSSCCNENVDLVTGERWPSVVLCRHCAPFLLVGSINHDWGTVSGQRLVDLLAVKN